MICFDTDIPICHVCHSEVIGNIVYIPQDLERPPSALKCAPLFSALLSQTAVS